MSIPVLGVNFGTHDSAAAIVVDGHVVAAAEEERFTRIKQTKQFPASAIAFCMAEAGLTDRDMIDVALFADPRLQWLLAVANTRHAFPQSLGSLKSDLGKAIARRALIEQLRDHGLLAAGGSMTAVRHHLAHAASAYLASPFDEACVVTMDGRGEYETACVFSGRGGRLIRRHSLTYPHSIGYLYSMMTRYLGFRPQRDEYRVMGLAAYGTPALLDRVERLAIIRGDGRIRLDLRYFDHHRRPSESRQLYSKALVELLGPSRGPEEPIGQRHRDIAYATQKLTERLILAYVGQARRLVPSRNLCLAGGVALNGVANAAIIESGWFDHIYIQPAANDAGTSMGAALHVAASRSGAERREVESTFLGPSFATRQIAEAAGVAIREGHHGEVIGQPAAVAAELLAQGRVIGWFTGRMEFGPRALGGRSVLAAAANAEVVVRINTMIKGRELFRPLAPAVQVEHADEWFDLHEAGRLAYPYMIATAATRMDVRTRIPAVVHVDGSARVQTVAHRTNPQLWRVIDAYRMLTGIPVVLNTSFNTADEPIVCTPQDAVATYLRCGLDALIIGDHLIRPPASARRS